MPAFFNQILILDSIPAGQLNTARRLYEDISLVANVANEAPKVILLRVESWGHFVHVIQQCTQVAGREPYVPLVHIECHGSEEGLEFADGSQATWVDIKRALIPLNVATELNLITVISACSGSAIASAVQITERAPVWGFVGPNVVMNPDQLEAAFYAFYRTFLMTQSSEEAAEALRATANAGTFMVMSSETIFALVMEGYRERFGGRDASLERARDLQARLQDQGVIRSLSEITAMLEDPAIMEDFRRTFFMIDLYPAHEDRFPRRDQPADIQDGA